MKKAVITGITGMDAANLAKLLLSLDYQVIGTERRTSTPKKWRLEELNILNNPNLIIENADLLDQGSLDRIMIKWQPDEVYNLAAQSFVGASWDLPVQTSEVTGLGALRVFEAVRNHSPHSRVYQAGSSEQNGTASTIQIIDEYTPFCPRSPYGVAKVFAHNMAINYRESYDLFISTGILMNHEGPLRGIEFVTRKVTDAVARISLGKQEELILYNLHSVRDWGSSEDFVRGMHMILQQDKADNFVLATGETHSIADLCKVAFEHVGIVNWREYISLVENVRPTEVLYLKGDASKAKEILGWSPTITFTNMIKEMVEADIKRVRLEGEKV